ncbi:HNH endonuclease [Rothia sp. ZJ932]|uniref:HNH endonuclease n=1 Tax=Rothia sp. ZJ932 TaxID=2810516 RepID=UPI0019683E22|nr:HNH endonuclease [Rothia sp. ZJ932]QRZ61799.1 hypothetical protein JR346_01255 [Rothia sp. ZJ932]
MSKEKERFFRHVVKGPDLSSCWIWTGAISNDGYGIFWRKDPVTGKDSPIKAHRYVLLLLSQDAQLPEGAQALHKCDNTLCVRASRDGSTHLVLGTRAENMADRARRGRSNLQSNQRSSKKQRAQAAREIRDYIKRKGYSQDLIDQLMKGSIAGQQTLF